MATPVFAVIGHGNEEPVEYEERPIVPPGYTVVLLTKPGQPFSAMDASFLWEKMYSKPSLFEDPVANKEAIEATGNQLRIYEAGTPMPAMRYNPQSFMQDKTYNFTRQGYVDGTLYIAGIYKLPLPFSSFETESKELDLYDRLNLTDIGRLYSGAANKQIREKIVETFGGTPSIWQLSDENRLSFTIEQVLAMNGPGVYYFFNCRYVKGLGAKLSNFIQRIRTDYETTLRSTFPEPSEKTARNIWFSHQYVLRNRFYPFDRLLEELLTAKSMLPEEKLPWLRNILLDGSYLEGNDELIKIKERKVLSNANLMVTVDKAKTLQNSKTGFYWHRDNADHFLALQKRKYLGWFDEEFGPLLRRLPLVRQKSNLGQAKYTRTGGKGKRNRKTRRRRSN